MTRAVFEACEAPAPLKPGFHAVRRDLYNHYPALVHARLFGASYPDGIHRTLRRLGFLNPGRTIVLFQPENRGT